MPTAKRQTETTDSSERADPQIRIVGARTHNLKNVNVQIPRQKLVTITGRSGSGKSSLAIDTLFAEGQRQYIESLSIYSRQFFSQLPRADVDRIEGLQPTLALAQHRSHANRRSTVGTITEIYDFLRLLMARVGTVHCYGCGSPIQQQTPQQIRDRILELPQRSKVMILSPLVIDKVGLHQEALKKVRKEGLVRVRVDGKIHDIDQVPVVDGKQKHTIEAIADRIIVREGIESRLFEAIENANRISSDGQVICCWLPPNTTDWQEKLYSTRYACPQCDIYYSEVQPRTFSFNNPLGACQSCLGLGAFVQFPTAGVVDRTKSVSDGAVIAWARVTKSASKKWLNALVPVLSLVNADLAAPLSALSADQFQTFFDNRDKTAPGLSQLLERELATTPSEDRQLELESLKSDCVCSECDGSRVSRQARSVFLADHHIGQLLNFSILELDQFIGQLSVTGIHAEIAEPLVAEIRHRLNFLASVGVGYLTLARSAPTLSGGEQQRVRLASSIGSGVTSVCFVLDEPSTGLHASDTDRLIGTLRTLQATGNSVVVVEHDAAIIRASDHVIEMGPAAGQGGGQVVVAGTPDEICQSPESVTGQYLSGREKIKRPQHQPVEHSADFAISGETISIRGAAGNNLQNIDVDIPLNRLCVVSGVSGSGKSTLIAQTLVPAIKDHFELTAPIPAAVESIDGLQHIDQLVVVNQKPIGRTPRACAATFCGLLDEFRTLFAATKTAKRLGFGKSRFTFNTKAGWCPACQGLGHRKIDMTFMPDVFVQCDVCSGRRFNLQTLQVKFGGRSLADVLDLAVDEALQAFDGFSRIRSILKTLSDVGLGYLKLGQSATTLSGGEAQRIKLARELSISDTETRKKLFVLDEPTSGLHSADIALLIKVLDRLVQQGHSLIVIEHDLDVIRCADWVIDLGPGGGSAGGQVIAACPPDRLSEFADSVTGEFL